MMQVGIVSYDTKRNTQEDKKKNSKARERKRSLNTFLYWLLPDIKQQIGFLLENSVDATNIHSRIVHLVPQSIAGLQRKALIPGDELHGCSTKTQAENGRTKSMPKQIQSSP